MKGRLYILFALLFFVFAFKKSPKVDIWLVGDSTMAAKSPQRDPESGWGEAFKLLTKEKAVAHNRASSGKSTKSYIDKKLWERTLDSVQAGDYVVIQFGHNDKRPDADVHTEPFTTYKENLKKFVAATRSKKAIPILCSPISQRHFGGNGTLENTHGDYLIAVREVATETNTAFVDMEALTRKVITDLGPEKSKGLFVFCKPGECPRRPRGVQDSTHLNFEGSKVVAGLFVRAVKEQKLSLKKFLK